MKYTYKLTIVNGKRVFTPHYKFKDHCSLCTKGKKKKRKKRKPIRPYVITDSKAHFAFTK